MITLKVKSRRRLGGMYSGLLCAGGARLATTEAERRAKCARQTFMCCGASATGHMKAYFVSTPKQDVVQTGRILLCRLHYIMFRGTYFFQFKPLSQAHIFY